MNTTVARMERHNGQQPGASTADARDETPATTTADGELIRRFVHQQDDSAFREIVRRYSPLVMSVALRTTHDRQAAEDVLQASFLVLVEKAESLDDPSQVAAWLHGVAIRIARRLVDKRHRHREQSYREANVIMDPAAAVDPFERVCETRDHDVLGEELQKLPAKFRTPMVLRYLEDLSNEQVAERLGLKVSTIEGRLKRGKKELRRRLARRGVTLGAAMLVWNMTQQAVAAAPVAGLIETVGTTALAWQTPTPSLAPPTDAAMSLAQQEITLMSTLKLTTAGTLAGTVLLATGLLVAMTGGSDDPMVHTADAGADRSLIETNLSDVRGTVAISTDAPVAAADVTIADRNTADVDDSQDETAAERPARIVQVFNLDMVDAELASRMLSALFESVGDEDDERRPVVRPDLENNRVLVMGEQYAHELTQVILQKLEDFAERDQLKVSPASQSDDSTNTAAAGIAIEREAAGDESDPSPDILRAIAFEEESLPFTTPHGAIQKVHESSRTVWINLGTDDGLRPQVRFRVHNRHQNDSSASGSFKGLIEVVRISGPHLAEARIVNKSLERPMTPGDIVYAPDWTPGQQEVGDPTTTVEGETAREFKIFQLQQANAESAVKMLKELVTSGDPTIAGAGNPAAPALSVDTRTNSVLAYGDAESLRAVEAILLRIDQPDEQSPPNRATGAGPTAAEQQLSPYMLLKQILEGDPPAVTVDEQNGMLIVRGNDEKAELVRRLAVFLEQAVSAAAEAAQQHNSTSRFDITHRSPAEQKIRRALGEPTSIKAEGKTMREILQELADRHEIDLQIDWIPLQPPDEFDNADWFEMLPVQFTNDVPLSTALDRLLRNVPSGTKRDASAWGDFNSTPITYFIQDEALVITTREVAEQTMQVRTYDLRPFFEDGRSMRLETIAEAIRKTTGDSTWAEQGGRGQIVDGVTTLIIRQSPLVHREIEALLEQLLHAAEASAEAAK